MNDPLDLIERTRSLLRSLSPTQSSRPEFEALREDVGTFLGEPVDDGKTITIKTMPAGRSSWNESIGDPCHQGMTSRVVEYTDEDGPDSYTVRMLPEVGPARYYKNLQGGIVVPINGVRYRIRLTDAFVSFERTDDPETEFQTWDARANLVEHIEFDRRSVARAEAAWEQGRALFDDEGQEALEEDLRWAIRDLKEHTKMLADYDESGEGGYRHPFDIKMFGQPSFNQNEVFPVHQGRCAMNLMTLETAFGDSGNENLLFACDENGVPCRVWTESSCC